MGTAPPSRRVPLQARAKERVERVLDAAEVVFAEVGFAAATTNQIAARAKTSVGSVYQFLGSKHAIAKALSERYLTEFGGLAAEALTNDTGADAAVSSLVDVVADFYGRHAGLRSLLDGCRGSQDLCAARDALQTRLVAPIEQLILVRRGAADPARCRVVAEMCAAIVWAMVGEVSLRPPEDRRSSLAELKLAVTSYVAFSVPPQGAAPSARPPTAQRQVGEP